MVIPAPGPQLHDGLSESGLRPILVLDLTLSPNRAQGQYFFFSHSSANKIPCRALPAGFCPWQEVQSPCLPCGGSLQERMTVLSSHLVKGSLVPVKFSVQTSTKS